MDSQDELDSDDLNLTPDDELEESRQDPLNSLIGDDSLPEDYDPPAANPTDVANDPPDDTSSPDDTHPSNDSDVDEAEVYDQGL